MPEKTQVRQLFNNIAEKYDLLNRIISVGIDTRWRKKALKEVKNTNPEILLDLASGTGDFAVIASKELPSLKKIYALDISENMLKLAEEKFRKKLKIPYELILGEAEKLPFPDNSIDLITIGFGIRNFENPTKALEEMFRVLKPRKKVVIIEPTTPEIPVWKNIFSFYFHNIVPIYGKIIANNKQAYQYLPNSVDKFPTKKDFLELCKPMGFRNIYYKLLTLETCIVYFLEK